MLSFHQITKLLETASINQQFLQPAHADFEPGCRIKSTEFNHEIEELRGYSAVCVTGEWKSAVKLHCPGLNLPDLVSVTCLPLNLIKLNVYKREKRLATLENDLLEAISQDIEQSNTCREIYANFKVENGNSSIKDEFLNVLRHCFPGIYNLDCSNLQTLSPTSEKQRYPFLQPVLLTISPRDEDYIILVSPYSDTTLRDVLLYDTHLLLEPDRRKFLVLQLLEMTTQLHNDGFAGISLLPQALGFDRLNYTNDITSDWWIRLLSHHFWPSYLNLPLPKPSQLPDLSELTQKWTSGQISNFAYLMNLASFAGRSVSSDPSLQPLIPWPTDFSGSGWQDPGPRDLTKSKYRLNKGDEQLDLQYEEQQLLRDTMLKGALVEQRQEAWVPHHITHLLSDTTTLVYHARTIPIPVLERFVRSPFTPSEYPSSLSRLYNWSPDEMTPLFFAQMGSWNIFQSHHPGMPDLTQFSTDNVRLELAKLLESGQVSSRLHEWIDLIYGYKLVGQAGLEAKNVALPLSAAGASENTTLDGAKDDGQILLEQVVQEQSQAPRRVLETGQGPWILPDRGSKHGIRQLFTHPHPPKTGREVVKKNFVTKSTAAPALSKSTSRINIVGQVVHPYVQMVLNDLRRLGLLLLELISIPNSIPSHSATSRINLMVIQDKFAKFNLDNISEDDVEVCLKHLSGGMKPLIETLLFQHDPPPISSILEQKSFFNPGIVSVYKFVSSFKSTTPSDQLAHSSRQLAPLATLSEEQYLLCLPSLLTLFNHSEAQVKSMALLTLFDEVAKRLGKDGTRLFLLKPIISASEVSDWTLRNTLVQPKFVRQCLDRFALDDYCERVMPLYTGSLISLALSDENVDSIGPTASALVGMATILGPIITSKYLVTPVFTAMTKDLKSLEDLQQVLPVLGFRFGEGFVLNQLLPLAKLGLTKNDPIVVMNSTFFLEKVISLLPSQTLEQEEEVVEQVVKLASSLLSQDASSEKVQTLAVCFRILLRIGQTVPSESWKSFTIQLLHSYLDDATKFKTHGMYTQQIALFVLSNFAPLIPDFSKKFPHAEELEEHLLDLSPSMDLLQVGADRPKSRNSTRSRESLLEPPTLSVHKPKKKSLSKRVVTPILNTVKKLTTSLPPPPDLQITDDFSLTYTLGITPSKPTLKVGNPLFAKAKLSVKEDKQAWNRLLGTLDVENRDNTDFRDLRLRHFMGHTGKITKLTTDEANGLIVSGSKDKTVKLWSLDRVYKDIEGALDWSEAQMTYSGHAHGVNDVFLLDNAVGSCDGDVHVWNVETGKLVTFFDAKSSLVTCRWVDNSFVGASADKLITFRDNSPVSIWKAPTPPSSPNATIKQLAVDPNDRLLAIGWSTGHCSLFDRRNGQSLVTWKSHEGEINQIGFYTSNYIVASSATQQGIHVWNLNDLNEIRTFKGSIDVNAFTIQGDDMIVLGATASTVNFVSLTNNLRSHAAKIRTRSPLTAVSMLPVNGLIAFGCLEGEVMLYA